MGVLKMGTIALDGTKVHAKMMRRLTPILHHQSAPVPHKRPARG